MDLFGTRLVHDDVAQESDEFGRGVSLGCLAQHLARFGIQAEFKESMP
jgi:hypothetical protein